MVVFFQAIVERLAREAPGVALDFLPLADDPDELLQRGEIDFLVLPEMYMSRSHPRAALFEEKLVCVGCRTNKQLSRKLTFEKYMSMGHVAAKFGRTRRPPIEEWFLIEHGLKRRRGCRAELQHDSAHALVHWSDRHDAFVAGQAFRKNDAPADRRSSAANPVFHPGSPMAGPSQHRSGKRLDADSIGWSRSHACLWRAPPHQLARPFRPSSEWKTVAKFRCELKATC